MGVSWPGIEILDRVSIPVELSSLTNTLGKWLPSLSIVELVSSIQQSFHNV